MRLSPKKIVTISAISALVIVGVGFLVTQVNGDSYVPEEFFTQRVEGAGAARNIARLVADSLANLEKIEDFDRIGNVTKALELVTYERTNIQEKQAAAVRLSTNLERMAKATESITPASARELSVQAVSTGVALVSRLINYNSLLDSLFEELNTQFSGNIEGESKVRGIVTQINEEAQTINKLNEEFNSLLDRFDRRFVK